MEGIMFNLADYETVESRLEKWHEKYPDNRIETELIEANDKRFIVFAKIFKTEADQKPCATGLAFEIFGLIVHDVASQIYYEGRTII